MNTACAKLNGAPRLALGLAAFLLLAVQTTGLALEVSKMKRQRAKMQTRESAAKELAQWLSVNVSSGEQCVSITHQGDNAKEVIAAAFYFARRDIKPLDFPELVESASLPKADVLLVEKSLIAGASEKWNLSQPDLTVGQFAIFRAGR